LLGVKTSYGGAVLIRNEEESKKLEIYQKYVPDLQEALPLDKADLPSKRGHLTPWKSWTLPFAPATCFTAINPWLTIYRTIRGARRQGQQKIFFKNFMDARVNEVILPLPTA